MIVTYTVNGNQRKTAEMTKEEATKYVGLIQSKGFSDIKVTDTETIKNS